MKIHIVQKGDTLWKIAKKYGVNFEELKKMNTQLSNPDMIMPGMKIKVPGSGGSIKKEAPIGGMPEAKISMGAKKEMPIAEHPFAKEKPKPLPVVEGPQVMPKAPQVMPKAPIKEVPIKEVPIKEAPIQAPPKMEAPIVMAPKTEAIKEVPVKPFVPKMPKPVVPEKDISNYYMMNMANLSAQQPPPPKEMPQLPPKPVNILPPVKPIAQESPESIESESSVHIHQGGFNQPMLPYYPQSYYPVSPVMPGTGLPGGYPQTYGYPQVQGAAMPMYQAPAAPMYQMPHHGLAGVESPDHYESSSSSMPMHHHMPYTNPAYTQAQMPAQVMGAEQMAAPQMPLEPTYTAPVMQPAYGYPEVPCPPYPAQMYPISPVMPGSGFCEPMPYAYPQMYEPYGYPQMAPMPQVQGVMEEPGMAQMPIMPMEAQMPIMPAQSQMPIMPTQSQMPLMPAQAQMPMMPVQAAKEDCGCGGPQMVQGAYNPGYGMYEMGTAPMYGAPYGQQMGYPMTGQMNPYMSPYGYGPMGGQAFGMPRSFDESSEYED